MNRPIRVMTCLALVLVAQACSSNADRSRFAIRPDISERTADIGMLKVYDANNDGTVSLAEMDAGLKAAFEAADTNKNNWLDAGELAAENERRWKLAGSGASPVLDWNQDGQVDLGEFSSGARSLFAQFDRDENGVLDKDELTPPRRLGTDNHPPREPKQD